uniref:Haloacid dehalogenase-like hydrolase domain-containing protein 3 n=1 Tax=Tanacetum cinerariifolium TaxID=118510 RepID=A0A6L2N3M1_TANCI|nr:haloacid dehalogenase-like hydrolase domain-containing protein 3 [Tanacetum cinerariifolium]
MGLWYAKDTGFELTAFLDSDHTGCLDTRKSTSGGIQFLGSDKIVSWSSKKQDCTLMSTAEAEYVSLSACSAQVLWMRTQLTDYGFHLTKYPCIMIQRPLTFLFDFSRLTISPNVEVAAEKPNPMIFLKACELLGVEAEDAVHVGDDRRNDLWGARDAGCDAWLWGSDVHSFKEIAKRIGVEVRT